MTYKSVCDTAFVSALRNVEYFGRLTFDSKVYCFTGCILEFEPHDQNKLCLGIILILSVCEIVIYGKYCALSFVFTYYA